MIAPSWSNDSAVSPASTLVGAFPGDVRLDHVPGRPNRRAADHHDVRHTDRSVEQFTDLVRPLRGTDQPQVQHRFSSTAEPASGHAVCSAERPG